MRALVLREHGGLENLVFEPNYPDPSRAQAKCCCASAPARSTITTCSPARACRASGCRCRSSRASTWPARWSTLGDGGHRVRGRRPGAGRPDRPRRRRLARRDHGRRARRARPRAGPHADQARPRRRLRRGRGAAGRLRHRLSHDVDARQDQAGRDGADPRRLRRRRHLLRAARQAGGRDRHRLRLERREAGAAQGARRRCRHQLCDAPTGCGNASGSSAAPAFSAAASRRHRRRREFYRRRHLDPIAAGAAQGRAAPHLRRHRGLRSQGGHPLHLDVRAQHHRLERLVARGRAGAPRDGEARPA